MAITKLLSPNTPNPITAGPNGDWDLAMAQLTAVKKLLAGEQMMLTEWTNATTQPKLALGTHLQHKGSIYVVDTEDYALPALGGNGTYYIVLEPSGSSLVGSWVTSLGGYTWDATYNGLYNGDKLVLPYQIVVDGSDIVKRKILNPWIDGGFTTVDWMGNVRGASLAVTGAISGASVNTGHGANELYPMNQGVRTTDAVTFATVNTGQGATEVYLMNQNLRTTDSPTFAAITAGTINTGYGAYEVFKISTAQYTADKEAVNIAAMDAGEIRFVSAKLTSGSGDSKKGSLKTPSGGSYIVVGIGDSSTFWSFSGYTPGNTEIVYAYENQTANIKAIIRRV